MHVFFPLLPICANSGSYKIKGFKSGKDIKEKHKLSSIKRWRWEIRKRWRGRGHDNNRLFYRKEGKLIMPPQHHPFHSVQSSLIISDRKWHVCLFNAFYRFIFLWSSLTAKKKHNSLKKQHGYLSYKLIPFLYKWIIITWWLSILFLNRFSCVFVIPIMYKL